MWPGEATKPYQRRPSPFKATWGATLSQLKTELRALGAKNVVVEVDMDASEIRRDGYPRAGAKARGPGVVLSLDSKFGPLRYPCDRFTKWEDNLRAITLALEALRKVDRYGVTKRGEQYTGWSKLPPAGGSTVTMDVQAAAAFMAAAGDSPDGPELMLRNSNAAKFAYKVAAKKLHPDAGGTDRDFQTLGEAKRALDAHHGQ